MPLVASYLMKCACVDRFYRAYSGLSGGRILVRASYGSSRDDLCHDCIHNGSRCREIGEFGIDQFFGTNEQRGLHDTVTDLVVGTIAGVLVAVSGGYPIEREILEENRANQCECRCGGLQGIKPSIQYYLLVLPFPNRCKDMRRSGSKVGCSSDQIINPLRPELDRVLDRHDTVILAE